MTAVARSSVPSLPRDIRLEPGGHHRYFILDVFTGTPLEGNQLAVFADGRRLPSALMQRVARELNLPETVFLLPPRVGGDARIRIFTPGSELPFAGHPTLGAAFVVATATGRDDLRLETGRGLVPVRLERTNDRVVFGWMEQPLPSIRPYERAAEILDALNVRRSLLPVDSYENGPIHVFVRLASDAAVAALEPDLAALRHHAGVAVNCVAGSGGRWKSRMFAPSLGVPEDPATGSAAGPLAIHLTRHGVIGFGERIEIRQGVEILRPSLLHARVEGDAGRIERVEVGGPAVIVARGDYRF